jgi:hypothetical protein
MTTIWRTIRFKETNRNAASDQPKKKLEASRCRIYIICFRRLSRAQDKLIELEGFPMQLYKIPAHEIRRALQIGFPR